MRFEQLENRNLLTCIQLQVWGETWDLAEDGVTRIIGPIGSEPGYSVGAADGWLMDPDGDAPHAVWTSTGSSDIYGGYFAFDPNATDNVLAGHTFEIIEPDSFTPWQPPVRSNRPFDFNGDGIVDELTHDGTHNVVCLGEGPIDGVLGIGNFDPTATSVVEFDKASQLDLVGDIVHAINMGGERAARFQDEPVFAASETPRSGVSIQASRTETNWHTGIYGNQAIDQVLSSIAWDPTEIQASFDVVAGERYKVQMLFTETCCDRGFDITLDGENILDDFVVHSFQGGIDSGSSVLVTHEFEASDNQLQLLLGGTTDVAADPAPMISAITIERLPAPIVAESLQGYLSSDGKIVLEGDFVEVLGLELMSEAGNLIPGDSNPFSATLSNTENRITIGNLGEPVLVDSSVVLGVGFSGPLDDLTASWGDANGNKFELTVQMDIPGDANRDGNVSFSDFLVLSSRFGNAGTWTDGDFNRDGFVGFSDFLLLSENFGFGE